MILTPHEYLALEARFETIFAKYRSMLPIDVEAGGGIKYLVDHGELEMAAESFCLQIMKYKVPVSVPDCEELRWLGLALGLNKESVYEADFWTLFSEFIHQCGGEKYSGSA